MAFPLLLLLLFQLVSTSCALFGTSNDAFSTRAGAESSLRASIAFEPTAEFPEPTQALVLMDAFCPYHGGYLASQIHQCHPDTAVVFVLSDYLRDFLQTAHADEADEWQAMQMPTSDSLDGWLPPNLVVRGIYCESDSGLADAEKLRALLQVPCADDPIESDARRNKQTMMQVVGEAGLAVPRSERCESLKQALQVAQSLWEQSSSKVVVVKPFRGVASESVHLCANTDDVTRAWTVITDSTVFGAQGKHTSVLVQEFLEGTEYALDVVSRKGEHKIAAVWRYDKRPANGAPFCYYQTRLVDADTDDNVSQICAYTRKALEALGVHYGLSHNEVIVTKDGPRLVEVNHRQHNMDFLPLVMACIGYNCLDMTLQALLDGEFWDSIPDEPRLRAHGCMVHLVNSASGVLQDLRHLPALEQLESLLHYEIYEPFRLPGTEIEPTVDIRTDAGWAQLIHEDPEVLQKDYEAIVGWMPTMFEVE